MRVKLAAGAVIVVAMGLISSPGAFGQSEVVSATVLDGVRALLPGGGIAMSGSRTTISGGYSVTVTETGATGSQASGNGWAVTASLSSFTGLASGASIGASTVTVKGRDVKDAVGGSDFYTVHGGTPGTKDGTKTGDGGNFGTPQTLFEIDGESAGIAYSGTFVGSGNLEMAVPASAPGDAYSATLTYTLVD